MKDGFIKVAAATPEIRVADCAFNARRTVAAMTRAQAAGVKLLVLPELGLTGYTCSDLFFQDALLLGARQALDTVLSASRGMAMVTVCGLPVSVRGKLYNCAAVVYEGSLLGLVPKTYLPNYNEFYEARQFTPAPAENFRLGDTPFGTALRFTCADMPAFSFGAEICEDLWSPDPPSTRLALDGATIIVNLSASNEIVGKDEYRRSLVANQSARLLCGYVYADAGQGESTTDLVFAGHNIIAENGAILAETQPFTADMAVTELDVSRMTGERRKNTTFRPAAPACEEIFFDMALTETTLTRYVAAQPFIPNTAAGRDARCERILAIQAHGLATRLSAAHAKTAVIGISGGLDSTLALIVAARAMDLLGRPRTDIVAVTMPCFGTTARTKSNAEKLCDRLGVRFSEIDIGESVRLHFRDIGHDFENHNVVFENGQARERTQVLMDVANAENGLVVGTGDLSELALGWATYNGDHMSMYAVNASVPKTLVRYLVTYAAGETKDAALRDTLLDVVDTPVSPELLPAAADDTIAQRTEDLVGPYELHDFFLYYLLRWGFSPRKIYRLARHALGGSYDAATIKKWLIIFCRRFFAQQFKRSCLPDGPKVGSVALSPRGDWRMPSDASSALWLSEAESL